MSYFSVPVVLPNGKRMTARLGGPESSGFRHAYVKVGSGSSGTQRTVSGRVQTRHGYDGRPLLFEVLATGVNAELALDGVRAYAS